MSDNIIEHDNTLITNHGYIYSFYSRDTNPEHGLIYY